MIKIFLDASVIISALFSLSGGSNKLIQFVKLGVVIGITSQNVIEEVERNCVKIGKSPKEIRQFINDNLILIRNIVSLSETKQYKNIVVEKDAHVVAGAKLTKCNFLVTLDQKHLLKQEVVGAAKPLKITTPKELLEELIK